MRELFFVCIERINRKFMFLWIILQLINLFILSHQCYTLSIKQVQHWQMGGGRWEHRKSCREKFSKISIREQSSRKKQIHNNLPNLFSLHKNHILHNKNIYIYIYNKREANWSSSFSLSLSLSLFMYIFPVHTEHTQIPSSALHANHCVIKFRR
jgi:hypothetical protein